jgi:putative copper resistance protein D
LTVAFDGDHGLILCRFLFDGAGLFLWGVSVYLACLVPARLSQLLDHRLRVPLNVAVLTVVATTAVMLPLRAAAIGDGWRDALSPSVLQTVVLDTGVGRAWLAQACLSALLVATFALPGRHRLPARAVCAGLLLLTLAISGHAAMNSGWLRVLHRANDALHLLSGGAWLGALVPVLAVLPLLHDIKWQYEARLALTRFSTAGHVAVALVLLSGTTNTMLIVGGLPSDWSSNYQLLLSAKIGLVGVMVILAIVNRYAIVPRLGRSRSLRTLKLATTAEVCLGVAVVALVAWLGTLPPV